MKDTAITRAKQDMAVDCKRAKYDEVYFIEKILKLQLYQVQKKLIEDPSRRKLLRCGRRWAKTWLSAAHCIYLATKPNWKIGVYGPGWEEVSIYMDWIREHIAGSLVEGSVILNQRFNMVFSSRARIIGRVASIGSKGKRGRGFNHLAVDEAAHVSDADMAIIRPTTLDLAASEWLTSTPSGHNHFFRAEESGEYKIYHFTTYDNPRIAKKDIDKEKKLMTDFEFQQEIMGEYLDDSHQPIPHALIEKAINNDLKFIDNPQEGHRYVAGLDLGRKRDRSVFVILDALKNNQIRIAHIKEFTIDPKDPRFWVKVLDHAEFLCDHFGIEKLLVDSTAMGDKPVLDLKLSFADKGLNTKIEGVNFSYAIKNKWEGLINQLCLKFERFQIHFPFHMELVKQLKSIRFDARTRIFTNVGRSPDVVMALSLGLRALPSADVLFYSKGNRMSSPISSGKTRAVSLDKYIS